MKIVIFVSSSTYAGKSIGGAEISLTLLAQRLGELGQQVDFVTKDKRRYGKGKQLEESSYKVHLLPVLQLPMQRFKLLKRLNDKINSHLASRYFSKHFSDHDIGHGTHAFSDVFFMMKWKRKNKLNIKVVLRSPSLFWRTSGIPKTNIPNLPVWIYNHVDSVCFIQQDQPERFITDNNLNGKVNMKDHFVQDIGVVMPVEKQLCKPQEGFFKCVMAGRFTDKLKRQDLLIEAFKNLGIENSELVLAGEGPHRKQYMAECQNDPFLKDRVRFTGFISRQELIEECQSATVFCLASNTEGLSKSVIEAMSQRMPVVASDVSVLNLYIVEGENGFLAQNTVEGWTSVLRKTSQMPLDELMKVADTGYRFCLENYDSRRCGQLMLDQFNRIKQLP